MNKALSARNLWLLLTVILGGLGALLGYRLWEAANPVRMVSQIPMPEIEEVYGIRFTQVAVTADGGLVDIRFQVIDPVKATAVFGLSDHALMLVEQESGMPILGNTMASHGQTYEAGRTYWMLYYNTRGALKIGSVVTLVIGDYQVENVLVQ